MYVSSQPNVYVLRQATNQNC